MPNLQLTPGSFKPSSPKAIKEHGRARDSFTRTMFGGSTLILLVALYGIALVTKAAGADAILGVVGTGLGFLIGGRDRGSSSDD